MIRRRAEHNEGMITTLEELALHQQNIEKIELLGQVGTCIKVENLQLHTVLLSRGHTCVGSTTGSNELAVSDWLCIFTYSSL